MQQLQQLLPADKAGSVASVLPRRRLWHTPCRQIAAHAAQEAPLVTNQKELQGPVRSPKKARHALALRIYQPKDFINWDRWEVKTLQIIEAREAAEAAQGRGKTEEEEDYEPLVPTMGDIWASHFQPYDNPAVHQAGLQDEQYMGAWATAISNLGPTHIKGKVVVDVGCGPGVLSLMCAKAGAKKVIAVDASQAMVDITNQVASANGYGGVIEGVCGRAEDVRLKERADVLVCSWPGPGLMGGGMLRTVAVARRTLLKPGGLVLPSTADIYLTGIEDRASLAETKRGWDDVAGFDLAPAMTQVVLTPRVTLVPRASQLCTSTAQIAHLEMSLLTPALASRGIMATPFQLECQRDERLFGLALHFDLGWAAPATTGSDAKQPNLAGAAFTTDPRAPPTHFQQLVLNFPRSIKAAKGDVLSGTLAMVPSGSLGQDVTLDVTIEFAGVTAGVRYKLVHSVPLEAHAAMVRQAEERR